MTDGNIIPFRKRPPSKVELEYYRRATRNWSPELKRMMFPEYFRHEQEQGKQPG